MAWKSYSTEGTANLDQIAQRLVLGAKKRDRESLNQAFKMHETVPYGLERFWGEHLRLQSKAADRNKSIYWKETWDSLVQIMENAGVIIPNHSVNVNETQTVENMAQELWKINLEDQRITLAVLNQLCDSLVWWTQRYKGN